MALGEQGPSLIAHQGNPEWSRVFHEAGHAVVSILEGKALRSVSAEGSTIILEPEEEATNDYWGVRVALAGFVADHTSSGDKEPLSLERMATGPGAPGSEHDFRRAWRLAKKAMSSPPTSDAIRNCLCEQWGLVTLMLQANWRAVEMVAAALMAEGELTGERVAELVSLA